MVVKTRKATSNTAALSGLAYFLAARGTSKMLLACFGWQS